MLKPEDKQLIDEYFQSLSFKELKVQLQLAGMEIKKKEQEATHEET